LLRGPEKIWAVTIKLIEEERIGCAGYPEQEAKAWAEKIAECERLRAAYQDQQAASYMTLDELGAKLKELENTYTLARTELEHLIAYN
jgi:hypothetical protein